MRKHTPRKYIGNAQYRGVYDTDVEDDSKRRRLQIPKEFTMNHIKDIAIAFGWGRDKLYYAEMTEVFLNYLRSVYKRVKLDGRDKPTLSIKDWCAPTRVSAQRVGHFFQEMCTYATSEPNVVASIVNVDSIIATYRLFRQNNDGSQHNIEDNVRVLIRNFTIEHPNASIVYSVLELVGREHVCFAHNIIKKPAASAYSFTKDNVQQDLPVTSPLDAAGPKIAGLDPRNFGMPDKSFGLPESTQAGQSSTSGATFNSAKAPTQTGGKFPGQPRKPTGPYDRKSGNFDWFVNDSLQDGTQVGLQSCLAALSKPKRVGTTDTQKLLDTIKLLLLRYHPDKRNTKKVQEEIRGNEKTVDANLEFLIGCRKVFQRQPS